MKKYLITPSVLLTALVLHAQQDLTITGTKQLTKEMTPQQVVDSLTKKFPNAKSVQYYQTPASGVDKGWNVTTEDNLPGGSDVDYYTVSFKSENLTYYALYSADGTLLKSKIEQTSTNLPEAIKTSLMNLSQQYPGYKMVSKTYYKDVNYSKSKEYYEIVAEKGDAKKTIYYAPDGTIVKMKDN